ncbi:MAG TPA: IclR family transcriptional regulator C-terminal domain-containing protein [Acetobacteraceae bacterium]|nr:IclR family transcriptional regulator C-terminal domain-containing protein [Acetobacteraceae bacterium]
MNDRPLARTGLQRRKPGRSDKTEAHTRSDPAAPRNAAPRAAAIRRVPAVTRAVAILRLLSRSDTPLGVHPIARSLGLVPSTCLHILRALAAEELVSFDPETKRYALAGGILALARAMLRHDAFANLAQPILNALSAKYGVTAIGVEAAGLDHFTVTAISRPGRALRLQVDIGSRYPTLISASGRCFAAFGGYAWSELERRFRALRWDDPPELAAWRAEIEATRRNGYAVDEGRYIAGVTIVAAPVIWRERASHALVVVGVSEQLRRIGVDAVGNELRALAGGLSRQLQSA